VTIAVGDREVPGEVQRGVSKVVSPSPASTPTASAAPAVTGYTLSQVASNNRSASCWSIIDGSVYNLTNWIASHPGGSSAITSLCGVDGTASFKAKHGSQSNPAQRLSMYLLGPLAK
jgi:cytochrome b involved in lipid metabolism